MKFVIFFILLFNFLFFKKNNIINLFIMKENKKETQITKEEELGK